MKTKKNIIRLVCLAIVLGLSFSSLNAQEASADIDYEYEKINYDSEIKITLYYGDETEVRIPEMIEGLPVTAIGEEAFAGNKIITKLWVPCTVRAIEKLAFTWCPKLTEVYLDLAPVATIQGTYDKDRYTISVTGAFAYCQALKKVVIEENCCSLYMGEGAFYGCSALETVILPRSARDTSEGYGADWPFIDCRSLKTINFRGSSDERYFNGYTDPKITFNYDYIGE